MVALDWHLVDGGAATLVSLVVTSATTERVHVSNCLDGPVWPPRRQGVPEEGWDENGFEGVVEADGRLVLGYASPAEPREPPARITASEPENGDAGDTGPREVIRALGDPTPPRDAVAGGGDTAADSAPSEARGERETGVEPWLDDVESRLECAERLSSASSVAEASAAVSSVGGPEDVARLQAQLDEDHHRLERVAERCETLAARVEDVAIPVGTLERLA
jgi:hypothetical protein